jgi:hypothetical protein
MTYRGVAALVLSVVAAGAWLVIATGLVMAPPARTPPEPTPVTSPLDPAIRSVQSQSARLHAYLASVPVLAPPSRDPFAFSRQAPQGRGQRTGFSAGPATGPGAVAVVARPALALAGIAEDASIDGPVRTAIISGMGQVFLVKEGEPFGVRFEVVRLGAESALIRDRLDQTTFTLSLK